MKKTIGIFFALIAGLITAATYPAQKSKAQELKITIGETQAMATVKKTEGIFVFILSEPVQAYDFLGTVKAGITWNGQAEENYNSILKRVKKDYPTADGIIFHDISLKKVDAIKFK